MLKKCVPVFGLNPETEKRKKLLDLSVQLKDITVRIVHAGGREEKYYNAIVASQLINKYPGMCVALPEVFKNPHASVLSGEDLLLPGRKYYIVPSTTVQKLKRRHPEKVEIEKVKEGKESDENLDDSEGVERENGSSVCSAKEYNNGSKEKRSNFVGRKGKKAFVPPIHKSLVTFKGFGWEPSLESVQELSQ